jgi:hypothetical protein
VRIQRYLFGKHDRVNRAVRALSAVRGIADDILAYTRGDLSYGALRRRIVFKFPLSALRLARSAAS